MSTQLAEAKSSHDTYFSATPSYAHSSLRSSSAAFSVDSDVSLRSLSADRVRWESLFEPHYSFHVAENHSQLVNGKDVMPSMDQELRSTEAGSTDDLFSIFPTPTLPRLDVFKHHHYETTSDHQIEILPCPSQSLDAFQRGHTSDQQRWLDRLDLLDTARRQGLGGQNDSHVLARDVRQGTKAARWRRLLALKAEQIKRDCKVDEELDLSSKGVDSRKAREIGGVSDEVDEKEEQREQREQQQRLRRSFLYFALGFIFPPIWIVGALYTPAPANTTLSSANRRTDLLWKRRSRNAFCIFLAMMIVILVLTLVFKPASVGWRQSKSQYSPAPDA